MSATLSDRLREVVVGSKNAFAKKCGFSETVLRQYMEGSIPSAEKAAKIADVAGVELRWLVTGEGPKFRSDVSEKSEESAPRSITLDRELFGHIVDRISRTYKAEGIRLSELDLGRIAAEKYPEIAAFNAPRDEWQPLLDLLAIRLRKEINAAVAEPGSGKASA